MMIRLPFPAEAASGARPVLRIVADRPLGGAVPAILHAAAFALLCLWTQTAPDTLRRQIVTDADPGFGAGR